ncbi:hypothetical protein JBE27_35395 [Streptomyces albiflaviniger]|nr:hypothetical protein [Streptomyces albiflaviniger]
MAAARSALSPEAVALISYTGSLITLLRRVGNGDRAWRGFHDKAYQVRFAVFQALLAGEPMPARRMTTGAVPPLLEADRLRVHLLHCPPADRDRIERAYQDPSGYHGPDLMVQCPAFKEHLICLITDGPGDGPGDGDKTGSSIQAGGRGETLRTGPDSCPRARGVFLPRPREHPWSAPWTIR